MTMLPGAAPDTRGSLIVGCGEPRGTGDRSSFVTDVGDA